MWNILSKAELLFEAPPFLYSKQERLTIKSQAHKEVYESISGPTPPPLTNSRPLPMTRLAIPPTTAPGTTPGSVAVRCAPCTKDSIHAEISEWDLQTNEVDQELLDLFNFLKLNEIQK